MGTVFMLLKYLTLLFKSILLTVLSLLIRLLINCLSWDLEAPCLSAPAESTLESSPLKIWNEKLLPGEKMIDFHLPNVYYII